MLNVHISKNYSLFSLFRKCLGKVSTLFTLRYFMRYILPFNYQYKSEKMLKDTIIDISAPLLIVGGGWVANLVVEDHLRLAEVVEAYCKMAITLGTTGYALYMLFQRGSNKQKEEIKKHIEETIKETLNK